jgi:hypothetical protein
MKLLSNTGIAFKNGKLVKRGGTIKKSVSVRVSLRLMKKSHPLID